MKMYGKELVYTSYMLIQLDKLTIRRNLTNLEKPEYPYRRIDLMKMGNTLYHINHITSIPCGEHNKNVLASI